MKTEFTGIYFNGITSKPYPCTIGLGGFSLDIRVSDESGAQDGTVTWDVSRISKPDVDFSHKIRLKYDSRPPQTIEVEDEQFASTLAAFYPGRAFSRRDMVAVVAGKWRWVAAAFLVLLGIGAYAFFVLVPAAAEYAATKVPVSIERAIGDSAYGQLTALSAEDDEAGVLVQEFFDAMPVPRDYDYTVTVLSSDEKNAFAMPGGRIAVCSGIIETMETPEELAALLLHESAHVELRHSLKNIFRSLSGYFFISLLFGDTGGITAVVFENIYVFKDLQYSRAMEWQADTTGLKNMRQAGFDPRGMMKLFNSIEDDRSRALEEYELTEFMSTHPLTSRRIEYIRELVDTDTTHYAIRPTEDSLFRRLKRICR